MEFITVRSGFNMHSLDPSDIGDLASSKPGLSLLNNAHHPISWVHLNVCQCEHSRIHCGDAIPGGFLHDVHSVCHGVAI